MNKYILVVVILCIGLSQNIGLAQVNIKDQLELTDEQYQKYQAISDTFNVGNYTIRNNIKDMAERNKRLLELSNNRDQKVEDLFSEKQFALWAKTRIPPEVRNLPLSNKQISKIYYGQKDISKLAMDKAEQNQTLDFKQAFMDMYKEVLTFEQLQIVSGKQDAQAYAPSTSSQLLKANLQELTSFLRDSFIPAIAVARLEVDQIISLEDQKTAENIRDGYEVALLMREQTLLNIAGLKIDNGNMFATLDEQNLRQLNRVQQLAVDQNDALLALFKTNNAFEELGELLTTTYQVDIESQLKLVQPLYDRLNVKLLNINRLLGVKTKAERPDLTPLKFLIFGNNKSQVLEQLALD